jgi:L,D-peptidoglycan transpeptidase YkuD (ErfK/YbiS/YcfS/YnhG family)
MAVLKVVVTAAGGPAAVAHFEGQSYPCVVGKTGVIAADDKREGDSKTPLGRWPLVAGFYRPDTARALGVCQQELDDGMGWCDAPGDALYNQMCEAGYAASHEQMWREDSAYDYVGVMDYNLDGAVAEDGKGRGSAIFLHVWREGATHTEGCVALRKADLEAILDAGVDEVEVVLA